MSERDPMRWLGRGVTGVTLGLGWLFIFWHNKFHLDPPVVVVALGFLAVVLAIANLWRVGAATVAAETADDEWARPLGEREELEKEKRTLLRSIKDSEFDLETGKLSKDDADALIRMYRARAIEVIKELERLDAGAAESPRQRIERELAVRLGLRERTTRAAKDAASGASRAQAAPEAAPSDAASGSASAQASPDAAPRDPASGSASAQAALDAAPEDAASGAAPAQASSEASPKDAGAGPVTQEAAP